MRSVALSIIVVCIALSVATLGTWAVFYDEEVSEGNYIEASTLDIHLENHDEDADQQWLVLNSYPGTDEDNPGQSNWMGSGQIKIFNDGSLRGDHLEIAFEFRCYEDDDGDVFNSAVYPYDFTYNSSKHRIGPESDTNQSGIGYWLKEIKLVKLNYGLSSNRMGTYNLLNDLCSADGDPECTMNDLANSVIVLPADYTPLVGGSEYGLIQMDFEMPDTGQPQNDWQGDVCEMIVHVALAQDSSQQVLSPGGVTVNLPSS
ncbi:hypothetical protein Ferp_1698 [Ferroglobus placidus DSM 10642]|uniref:SipW-cognate class signal peptide n=1 Tax=Ferroglobus placidus (strain DSM 10642 / AEDII12DO) TaxID=589924 RepID=D3RZC9_FERPA|nr:SipW-dependent-type signal peptide-containing protein [Ferroglobus placidus]ADC65842.1 hypothetical protein Ferp_1698 [Ferroglobus placidus DSM 10642]